MEKSFALSVVTPILVFAAICSLWTLRTKRKRAQKKQGQDPVWK
jgi:hypothetical protein